MGRIGHFICCDFVPNLHNRAKKIVIIIIKENEKTSLVLLLFFVCWIKTLFKQFVCAINFICPSDWTFVQNAWNKCDDNNLSRRKRANYTLIFQQSEIRIWNLNKLCFFVFFSIFFIWLCLLNPMNVAGVVSLKRKPKNKGWTKTCFVELNWKFTTENCSEKVKIIIKEIDWFEIIIG